jgi:protein-disulfide isomerase
MSKLKVPVGEGDHIQGDRNAPIELVEYGDYQCPYCGEAYPEVKALQQRMGKDMKFVFRNFPLSEMHKDAKNAAMAAEAAAAQGKFWEMHDMLYENQKHLAENDLFKYAEKIGLDLEKFKKDFKDEIFSKKIERDFEGGIKSGVNTTPSFYVNGERRDELNEEELKKKIKAVHT